MEPLLLLLINILIIIGIAWALYWGMGKIGFEQTVRAIIAGIIFLILLLSILNGARLVAL